MAYYRILIVDDEEEVRQGIIDRIDWDALNFEVVGAAENGQEALEMAENLQPDLILTDIKMPFMDGLTLCSLITEKMPQIKLIIFTGFDDFEYAKQAIQLNVVEYILKPVNANELMQVLCRVKENLDQDYSDRCNIEHLRQYYQKSIPILRQQFLISLLEGRVAPDRISEQVNEFNLSLNAKCYHVAVLQAEYYSENSNFSADFEPQLLLVKTKALVEQRLESFCDNNCFLYEDRIIILFKNQTENQAVFFTAMLNDLCRAIRLKDKVIVTAGIGTECQSLTDLSFSYKGALSALNYRLILGSGKAIYIKDVESDYSADLELNSQDEQELINAIKFGSSKEINQVVGKMVENMTFSFLPIKNYQIYYMEIIATLLKAARAYSLSQDHIFDNELPFYNSVNDFESLEEIKWFITELSLRISNLISNQRKDYSKLLVERAKQYISENFANSKLTVDDLCEYLHISATYLSVNFKKEMGMSFVQYLTKIRLEEAVYLLNNTDYKTYIIAEKVGYSEANYFSYVFKRHYGVTPSKYRSKHVQKLC